MAPTHPPIRECHDDLILGYVDKIDEAAVPEITHLRGRAERVPPRQKFFPIDSLRSIFAISDVRNILQHPCTNCPRHLPNNPLAHPDRSSANRILETDAALSLFALLVYLRYPLLMGIFLSHDAQALPLAHFSQEDLQNRKFVHLPLRCREQLATAFQEKKWQFSAPTLTDGSFQMYEEGTILPYLDEEKIGAGGFSKVFKVLVHPDYCALGPAEFRQPKIFARKEIEGGDAIEFVKEKTNLELIASLKDVHLVQILKTYQLGAKFNILFPYSETNLHEYLRKPMWYAPVVSTISMNPLWEQVLGITIALKKIIHFADPEDPGRLFFGYHLDLKPQNILVDKATSTSKDILKITDFGQTNFVESAIAQTTHVSSSGGTDAYAPPEFLQGRYDRVYDIWSLGIIVLEILAYAIRGVDGLLHPETGLDHVRHTEEGPHQTNSRFYTGIGEHARVKPAIAEWMDLLQQYPSIQDMENRRFVRDLLDLIKRMLEPQMRQRVVIDEVVTNMSNIFKMRASEAVRLTAESVKEANEVILVELQEVKYYPGGTEGRRHHSSSVPFIMVENPSHRLRTWVGTSPSLLPPCDQRQEMQLSLPFYHNEDPAQHSFEISFSALNDDYPISLHGRSIVVNDRNVARKLHMTLTGHIASHCYQLSSLELKKYQSIGSKLRGFASRRFRSSKSKEAEEPPDEPIPLWIELWIENPPVFPESAPSVASAPRDRRVNRQVNPGKETPRGRVVIYCRDRVYIIPFTRECQLRKQEDMRRMRSREIIFEPMDKKQSDFFNAAEIRPARGGRHPAIPMFHARLYEVEEINKFECEEFVLRFKNPDGPVLLIDNVPTIDSAIEVAT